MQAFAAETDMSVVDNKLEEEKTESGTEGTDNEETLDVVKGEQEEKDSVGESTEDDGEEQEEADFENENDGEQDDTEDEIVDSEAEQAEENTDVVEDEEKDKVEDLESREDIENQTELMADSGDIASGVSNDIVWVIDKNGKLTITGTGDWKGTSSPWYSAGYSKYILSAEVNVKNITDTSNGWQISNRIDISEGIGASVDIENWKPTTPDEKKRYACMGQEPIQYTLAKGNAYHLIIKNAMQGPMCFDSFEAVLGDYTIGRTYNIYPYPDKVYSMGEEVQFTIKIPEVVYKSDRTNKFYAYALIYK